MTEGTIATSKRPFLTTTTGVLLGCLACCALWGSAFPCIKIGYALFSVDATDTASQMLFAGVRFMLAGAMVVVGVGAAQRRPLVPARRDWPAILALATFQTFLQYLFFYQGLSKASGVTSSIIEGSSSFIAILFAALVFRSERLTGRKLAGCALGFAGVVLINLTSVGVNPNMRFDGEGFILISTCASAMSTCLIQRFSATHDPVMLSGWQFLVGGVALTTTGLVGGGHLEPTGVQAWALLAYMGFISAAGYSIWSLLLRVNPVSRISVFGFMNPVFGVVLSAILLSEGSVIEPWRAVAALALISVGIVIVNRATAKKNV